MSIEAQPRDEDAEADLICAVLVSSGRVLDDLDLQPGEFFRPAHETIWATALALHAEGRPVEVRTVTDALLRSGDLSRVGGDIAVFDLSARNVLPAWAPAHAAIVRERYARRTVIQHATRMQVAAANPTDDVPGTVEDARHAIDVLADRITGSLEPDLESDLDAAIDAIEHGTASMSTPWEDLDHLIGGWRKGAVYVIAARPGGGKSIAGLQAALDAMSRHQVPTVFASLEMARVEVVQRAYSQLGEVNLSHIMRGGPSLGVDEWERIAKARGEMGDFRFVIDDRSHPSVADLRGAVSRCVRRHGSCGLLVVDYLQLVAGAGRSENRQTEVAAISRALKIAAKDLHVPIVVLAQLNRNPADGNRPPRPSDLRESGAVEQDADVVILLHRDEEKQPDILHVGVGKNRHGPVGSFKLGWQGHYSRLTPHEWKPGDALRAAS